MAFRKAAASSLEHHFCRQNLFAPCDAVSWGGDDRGAASMRDVIAVAYFDGAGPFCGACKTDDALADIHIVDHAIQSIAFRSNEAWLKHTLFVGPERTPYSSAAGG